MKLCEDRCTKPVWCCPMFRSSLHFAEYAKLRRDAHTYYEDARDILHDSWDDWVEELESKIAVGAGPRPTQPAAARALPPKKKRPQICLSGFARGTRPRLASCG
jgi:hypothetical protein